MHNPLEDHDVVILDVDEYEKLIMKEQEEKWEQEMMLDEEIESEESHGPFSERDYHPADWHSVSDVISKKYASLKSEDELDFLDDDESEEIKIDDIPNFGPSLNENEIESEIEKVEKVEEIEKKDEEPTSVPFRPMGVDIAWQEEPLASDEPVFYEEPV